MSNTKPTAMDVRRLQTNRNRNGAWLLRGLNAGIICAGLVLALCEITGLQECLWILVPGVMLCAAYSTLQRWDRGGLFYIGSLSLLLLLVLFARNYLLEGFRLLWNQFTNEYLLYTGRVLPEWSPQMPESRAEICKGLCLVTVAVILSMVSTINGSWFLAGLPGMVLLAGICQWNAAVSPVILLAVLAAGALVLVLSRFQKEGTALPGLWSGMICTLVCGGLMLPLAMPGAVLWAEHFSESVRQQHHEKRYENSYTTLPEGDFRKYEPTEMNAQPALVVTMDQPQKLYLRGFTGETFRFDRWTALEREALVKNKDLLYWLNRNAFDPDAQYHSASLYNGLHVSTVTVQNIGACAAWRYVPYTLMGSGTDPEDLNPGIPDGAGDRVYTYQIVTGEPSSVLELLRTSDQPEILTYRSAETAYRAYVSHHYLQIPEEVLTQLEAHWIAAAEQYGGREQMTPQQAQTCAMAFLSGCFSEEGVTEAFELPLSQAEGSAFQYATVAAMTLRWFGIPARYAEGYVISAELAATVEPGQSLTVDSSNARAWVEVYQDGIGWMPMDLTPGLGELIQYQPDEGSNQSEGDEEDQEKPPEEEEEDSPIDEEQEVPDTLSGTMVKILKQLALALPAIVLAMLFLMFILCLRRRRILRNREGRYADPDIQLAVSIIAADTVALLRLLGFDRGNGSLRDLEQPLKESFGEGFAEAFGELVSLNERALFSSRSMEDGERETALLFRESVIEKMKTEQRWYKRLWQKWVRCLY